MDSYWVLKKNDKLYWESLLPERYKKIPDGYEQIEFFWKPKEQQSGTEKNIQSCWAIVQPDGGLWYESARKHKDLVIKEISNISIYEKIGYQLQEIIFYN